jgi:MoxR-like ATPase
LIMENVMAKTDTQFREVFEAKMSEMYPDVATRGTVSRPELLDVMKSLKTEKYPLWLMKNKVGRGLYSIDGGAPVVGNNALKPKVEMKQESFVVDYTNTASLIPKKDPNFVPFGNFADLENIIKSGIFYPAYISGPTGNGKSTMVEQICSKHKKPLIRVNLNMMTDEEQLIGSKTLVEGNVEVVEGPVLIAMRNGTTLLLDEIDAGSANTLLCLQPILEGKPYYFKLKNEMIVPADGFNIIATANTKGKGSDDGRYIGTNILNEAFLERFAVTFDQEYPNAKIEVKIIKNLMETYSCLDEEFAETLVKWADAIRRTFEDGGVDETITTRRMIHIVRAFAIFKKREKAVELCCNRFDAATKAAFIDLYDKVANPQPEVEIVAEVPAPAPDAEVPF